MSLKESKRLSVSVSNPNNQDCWVRFYPAALDNDKKGVLVVKNSSKEVMPPDNIYVGEISIIMDAGGNKTITGQEI